MKLAIKLALIFSFCSTLGVEAKLANYSITAQLPKACLAVSKQDEIRLPGLKAYYKGYKIDFSKGTALLPETQPQTFFSFIITPEIELVCSKNDNSISYLQRAKHAPIDWYDVSLITIITDANNKKLIEPAYQWMVEKRDTSAIPDRLPDQAIIILLNPKLIQTMSTTEQAQEGSLLLPSLVFNTETSAQELEEALTYATLSSIDLDTVHVSAAESFTKSRVQEIARTARPA
jgi:hypothetical protein